jgi:hypothetical protein
VLALALQVFLSWAFAESPEDGTSDGPTRSPRSFYNYRTWTAFHRLLSRRPPLLTYRRDRRGRFRKLR